MADAQPQHADLGRGEPEGEADDQGLDSEWPYTCRCLDCGYIGWPNTTDIRDGKGKQIGFRQACPRTKLHQEMVRIKITAWEEAPRHG